MARALASIRSLAVWLALLLALAAGEVRAQAGGSLALAPSRADAALEPLSLGFDRWLLARLGEEGLAVTALAAQGDLDATLGAAAGGGFAHVLVPRLAARDGHAKLQLLLFAPDSGSLLVAARSEAPTAEFGRAAASAVERVAPQLGARAGIEVTPPLLEDLAAATRAIRARRDGDLVAAFRAVHGKLSPIAMALREEIVAQARNSSAPAAGRARVLVAVGDPTSAWVLIGRAARAELKQEDPDPNLLIAAGEVMIAEGEAEEAHRYLDRLLALHPDDVDANAAMAQVLQLEGDHQQAREALAKTVELDPRDTYYAEQLARMEQDPRRSAARWIEAGRRSARRLDAQEARDRLATAVDLDPAAAPRVDTELGALEERLGRPEQARVAYQRAIEGGARTPVALTALGRIDYRMGNADSAEKHLRAALEREPTYPPAMRELGVVVAESGRPAEAVPILREAHQHDPADSRTRISLSRALRATGELDEALALMSGQPGHDAPRELAELAAMRMERGETEAARQALARAVALEPGDADLRTRFATVLEQLGDAAAAVAQRQLATALAPDPQGGGPAPQRSMQTALSLDDLVMSFAVQLAQPESRRIALLGPREPGDWKSRLRRLVSPRAPDLALIRNGMVAAISARFDNALPTEDAVDTLSLHVDQLLDFDSDQSLNAETIATLNRVLGIDGAFATRLVTHAPDGSESVCGEGSFGVEMRLLLGRDVDTASILSNFDCLDGGYEAYGRWNHAAFGIYLALLLLLTWPLIRGWGQITVHIALPERTKGFFSIHVTKRPDQVRREVNDKTKREKSKGSRFDFLRRYQRHMAGPKTTFRLIPARKPPYTVTVSGPLMDARGEEIIGHFLEEQRVTVRRRRSSELTFDFRPKEVAVEITIQENGRPATGARVAVQGDPASLRYAREGLAYLYLGLGSYTILAGSRDSAAQFEIEITSLDKAIPLQVDMGRAEGLVFQGCAAAVEPYLQSDLAGAARALDEAGDPRPAHLLRAELYRQQGRGEEAAHELEAAGQLGDAAEARTSTADFEGGAVLFEEAGEVDRAAQAYRAAGSFAEAARCYEEIYDYANALECWREAGDSEREMVMLEKLGEYMEAARIARERNELDRAIQTLQNVEVRHGEYGEACRMIAEIASQQGDHELAVAKFEEALSSTGLENASIESLESYAVVLELAGRRREALSAYEAIRRRDVARTDVAMRIQALKATLSENEGATQAVPVRRDPEESRYELQEEIGRGGMGVVYKARDKRLGRVVALKRLPENLRDHPAAVELFEREARAAASLNHPNIVTVFDAGEENGSYFITMELLEGRTLNAILERSERLSVADTMRLGIQICAGLNYAHERGIVHRDIKTANIFFTRDQVVKIMDFGIAKSIEEVRRTTTVVGGTPYYMAPEQASGKAVDHRADLYALGVTMFQLCTGALPFADGDVSYRHCHEEPPDPREINLNVNADLARLVLALMRKSPDQRPPSAAVVAAELTRMLSEATQPR